MATKKNPNIESVTAEIRLKRCYGCGAILQSTNKNESGYLPPKKLEESDDQLCERCYKLRHYGEMNETIQVINKDYDKLIEKCVSENSLIIYVIDAFLVNDSLMTNLITKLGKKVLVVVNKIDTLPRDFPKDKFKDYLQGYFQKFNCNPLDIIFISSNKNLNMDKLMEEIKQYSDGKDVYMIGVKNVGKSSMVNKILKNYKNKTNKLITTSDFPGTTIGVIRIPLDEETYLFDTPGVNNPESMTSFVETSLVRHIVPKSSIKPLNYQLKESSSIILGGLARFDLLTLGNNEKKVNVTFVFSNEVKAIRTKLEKADNTFKNELVSKNLYPRSTRIKDLKDFEKHEFVLPVSEKGNTVKISIVGYGFVMLNGNGQKISVMTPKGVGVILEEVNYRA